MSPPAVVLPRSDVFAARAQRLRDLSGRVEAMGEFLAFMAQVAQAQQAALEQGVPDWQPEPEAFTLALEHGMAPLSVDALRRDVDIPGEVTAFVDALDLHVGAAQRPLLEQLRRMPAEERDALVAALLDGQPGPQASRGVMPLLAAALQVAWVRLVQRLPDAPQRPPDEARSICPSCGSAPVASVIQDDPECRGARYLQCGLCATQWYLERARCSVCEHTGKLKYLSLEDDDGNPWLPVQAETCGNCNSYLKIMPRELDGRLEALADDLASLALDLSLSEEGTFRRSGYNPLFIIGE
ncbi:Tat proofreading chaperone FdhE [Modicisalibacter xianhensis]|uniref:Tat proofreading chaperone FdhE n=1 Tax=Modicisalibacter xianhensis TaxID=442341 RepID=A0A4R8FQ35_9GAMM|nr:formate dehydrogenase accessory protein FdhE [Halomonas xianhensis]TDX26178.1 Tat proofreading chaperone FdhE [Halomonas xianhensis]